MSSQEPVDGMPRTKSSEYQEALEKRISVEEQRMSLDIKPTDNHHAVTNGNGHAGNDAPTSQKNQRMAESNAAMLIEAPVPISLHFNNVDAWVSVEIPPGGMIFSSKAGASSAPAEQKQILHKISGSVVPGEVLALMGPSGSGKTSLLSIMGGRSPAKVHGDVLFNGAPMTKRLKRMMGFVTQDDQLLGNLTVYETLLYAALLRLPRAMPRKEKESRVVAVMEGLGISKCRDTIIGGFDRRGISGGERKRVSIGHELLINPALLLCDEPTSGLDSTTALRLVFTLRTLAKHGRTVVTTIHQPSSQAFFLLDKLTLLSEGHVIYYGQAGDAAAHFGKIGPKLPYGVNAADFLLDLASGEIDPVPDGKGGLAEGWDSARLELIKDYEESEAYKTEASQVVPKVDEASLRAIESGDRWAASWATQVQVLFIRTLKQRRFDALDNLKIIQTLLVGAVVGMLWWQKAAGKKLTEREVYDTAGMLFFEAIFMSFLSMFGAIFTFPSERLMLIKERRSAMYRLSAFYAARTGADIPLEVVVPSIFCWILYFTSGLELNGWTFLSHWFGLLLVVFVAQSFGLLVGAWMMNLKAAQTVASVTMLTVMLCGGYYVQDVPPFIAWVRHLSFMTYIYQLLTKLQFKGKSYICGLTDETMCLIGDSDILGEVKVEDPVTMDVVALLLMLVVLRVGVYLALRTRIKV